MKIKTSELEGAALDWAVCEATDQGYFGSVSRPSTDWSQCGPLLDVHCKGFGLALDEHRKTWRAFGYGNQVGDGPHRFQRIASGQTILIAACRAIVAAKLGDTVDVPDELL